MSERPRPTIDIEARGDAIAVVLLRPEREVKEIARFALATAAGSVALAVLDALHETYLAGLRDGHDGAQRAIEKSFHHFGAPR